MPHAQSKMPCILIFLEEGKFGLKPDRNGKDRLAYTTCTCIKVMRTLRTETKTTVRKGQVVKFPFKLGEFQEKNKI